LVSHTCGVVPVSSRNRRAKVRRQLLYVSGALGVVAILALASVAFPNAFQVPGGGIVNRHMHIHPNLTIYRGTKNMTVPSQIGINASKWNNHTLDQWSLNGPTFSPLHTHDNTGKIHVESTVTRDYTLGEFFSVWGEPVGPTQVTNMKADTGHRLSMTVDGKNSTAWGNLVFVDGQQIIIHYDNVTTVT